jgi:hypothetical protein
MAFNALGKPEGLVNSGPLSNRGGEGGGGSGRGAGGQERAQGWCVGGGVWGGRNSAAPEFNATSWLSDEEVSGSGFRI